MNRAYIPNLTDTHVSPDLIATLAGLGAAIIERGVRTNQKEIDLAAERAYGLLK